MTRDLFSLQEVINGLGFTIEEMAEYLEGLPQKPNLRPDEFALFFDLSDRAALYWCEMRIIPTIKLPGTNTVRIPRVLLIKRILECLQPAHLTQGYFKGME